MSVLASLSRCIILAFAALIQLSPVCHGFSTREVSATSSSTLAFSDRGALAGRFVVPLHRQRVPVLGDSGEVTHKSVYFGSVFLGTPQRQELSVVFDTGSGHVILPSSECHSSSCRVHRTYRRDASQHAVDIDLDGTEVEPGSPRDQITIAFGTGEVTGQFVSDMICLDVAQGPLTGAASLKASTLPPTLAGTEDATLSMGSRTSGKDGASINCVDVRFVAATEMSEDPFLDFSFDGVLGLGLASLALAPEFSFFEMLTARQRLDHPSFGIFLAAHDGETSEISFGGHSPERLLTELAWAPVAMPEHGHWMVKITSLRLDSRTLDFCNDGQCRAVVDSGTSLLAVPKGFAGELSHELETALKDPFPFSEQEGCKKTQGATMHFDLDGVAVALAPADYARVSETVHGDSSQVSVAGNTSHSALGATPAVEAKRCWAAVTPVELPEPLGPKLFILGEPLLRKYYTAFDWKDKKIGFALAAHAMEEPAVDTRGSSLSVLV